MESGKVGGRLVAAPAFFFLDNSHISLIRIQEFFCRLCCNVSPYKYMIYDRSRNENSHSELADRYGTIWGFIPQYECVAMRDLNLKLLQPIVLPWSFAGIGDIDKILCFQRVNEYAGWVNSCTT